MSAAVLGKRDADAPRNEAGDGAGFTFRVSDALDMPFRGCLLRLRRLAGTVEVKAVRAGQRLCLRAPSGEQRTITVLDHAITGGRLRQARLDRTGELDIVVARDEARIGDAPVEIGWLVTARCDSA